MLKISRTTAVLGAVSLVLITSPAFADAIDGNWCFTNGQGIVIEGSTVVTPAGKRMTGNYGRHDFSYVAPTPEPNAGSRIDMQLMGENTVHLRINGGKHQVWKRCQAPAT